MPLTHCGFRALAFCAVALLPCCELSLFADSASTKNVGPLPEPAKVWGVNASRYGLGKPFFMVDDMLGMTRRSETDSLRVAQIGGAEIWRLRHPNLPFKHFYPRQPKAPFA